MIFAGELFPGETLDTEGARMEAEDVVPQVGQLLGRVCELKHRRLRRSLDELGLYRGQPSMLRALWSKDGVTQVALVETLHRCPATITKMVQRMEKAGFVERKADPSDHRLSRVYLTDAGRRIQAGVEDAWRAFEEQAMAGLSTSERRLLSELLVHVCHNLEGMG
jgi:DNA-binding MarR family transcriptional regulator